MNIFFTSQTDQDYLILDEQESHHCIKVLRTKEGDQVHAVDGVGGFFRAVVVEANPGECRLKIIEKLEAYHALPYELHIGIAPTKSIDRFEWFLEKATEIGISTITPLICERSERRNLRMDRLEKVVISAMKQSMKAFKPRLNQALNFNEWLAQDSAQSNLIAHCNDNNKQNLWKIKLPGSIRLAIGPEGDFSKGEIDSALKSGFTEISLGDYRLRTETAGIVACSAVYFNFNQ